MLTDHDHHRLSGFRSLAVPFETRVWQRIDAPVRSPFFFVWGGERPSRREWRGPGGLVEFDRYSRAGLRDDASTARQLRRLGVKSVLAAVKAGMRDPYPNDDFDDDAILSVSRTALFDRSKRESDPGRYVETTELPFLTLSIRKTFAITGLALGDLATVIDPRSGRVAHAIVGDGRPVAGVEPSLFLREALGLRECDRAVYLIHPGSGEGQGTIPSNAEIHHRGDRLFRIAPGPSRLAWGEILTGCFADLFASPNLRFEAPGRPKHHEQ